jgi:tyrosyl-tRNA synthetase
MGFMIKTMSEQEAEKAVADILERGVGTFVDPDESFRRNLLAKAQGKYSKDIIVKFGVDPTRPDIHLGHAVVLRKLRQMQELGVKVVFLIGDYTAEIGDPTGKSKVRPEVEQSAIETNMQTYLDQVGRVLDLDPKVFSWIRNSDWFTAITDIFLSNETKVGMDIKLPGREKPEHVEFPSNSFVGKAVVFEETRMQKKLGVTNISVVTMRSLLWGLKHVTLAQLSERDMFQKRIKENESLYMHEMLYPVLQGIDSDVLHQIYGSCDLEVGGTDQTFNMLMGRKIMESNKKHPQAVLSFALLVGLDGKEKMSKSLDNYVGITDVPNDMFGKIMSVPDSALASYLELCTFTPMSEVETMTKDLKSGKLHPKEVKMDLAQQITEIYHGRDAGIASRQYFVDTFQNKELPKDMLDVKANNGTLLADVLIAEKMVSSKSEFRRLLDEGAIRIDGETKITDPFTELTGDIVLKIGKHRFLKITVTPK